MRAARVKSPCVGHDRGSSGASAVGAFAQTPRFMGKVQSAPQAIIDACRVAAGDRLLRCPRLSTEQADSDLDDGGERMNVGIIGAGRIGGTLARGLAAAGRDNYYPQPRAGGATLLPGRGERRFLAQPVAGARPSPLWPSPDAPGVSAPPSGG